VGFEPTVRSDTIEGKDYNINPPLSSLVKKDYM